MTTLHLSKALDLNVYEIEVTVQVIPKQKSLFLKLSPFNFQSEIYY